MQGWLYCLQHTIFYKKIGNKDNLDRPSYNVTLYKTDPANGQAISDVRFLLFSDDENGGYREAKNIYNNQIDPIITGPSGTAIITGLDAGTYYLLELEKYEDHYTNKDLHEIKIPFNFIPFSLDIYNYIGISNQDESNIMVAGFSEKDYSPNNIYDKEECPLKTFLSLHETPYTLIEIMLFFILSIVFLLACIFLLRTG